MGLYSLNSIFYATTTAIVWDGQTIMLGG
jgi:type II secretory pathway component GspD/PulD (secretin)